MRHFLMALALTAGASLLPLIDPAAADAGKPRSYQIVIEKFAFSPARLTVKPGDTIEWINRDLAPHTATAKDASFDTLRLKRNETMRAVAGSPGVVDYICTYHPNMKGVIVIVDGPAL